MTNVIEQKQNLSTGSLEIFLGDLFENNMDVQSVERNLARFLKLNKEQFSDFLEFLTHYVDRDELSQNFIEKILKRGLELSQIVIDKKYLDFDMKILYELADALCQPNLNFKQKDPEKITIADKAMRAFPACYLEFPEALQNFWCIFNKDGGIQSAIVINVLKEMNADPRVDHCWRDYNTGILKEKIGYYGYDEIIKKDLLAGDNHNSFQAQLKWLKFLRQIFIDIYLNGGNSAEENAFNNLVDIFEAAIEKLPNRLLKEYLRHILEAEITPMRYGRYLKLDENKETNFYDAEMVPEDGVERSAEESQYSPTQLANMRFRRQIDFGVKKISADFSGAVDKYGLRYILDKQDKLLSVDSVLMENLRTDADVLTKGKIIKGALDFSVLSDEFFVGLIKNEMGIDLLDMDLQTQFWFLDFLKDADDQKFLRVVSFVQKYKLQGVKTFLALEYDEGDGEKILSLAKSEKINQEEKEKIFQEFDQLIDHSHNLSGQLKPAFEDKKLDTTREQRFPGELGEAIRRRASDLFFALGESTEIKDQTFGTEDIILSFQALNLFLKILLEFKEQKDFTIEKRYSDNLGFRKMSAQKTEAREEFFLTDKRNQEQYILRIFKRALADERGEARISFTLVFADESIKKENQRLKEFFAQDTTVNSPGGQVSKRQHNFCLRLDRDAYYAKPLLSLDMGSYAIGDGQKNHSGDRLGNMLRHLSKTGHHNTLSFSQDLGEATAAANIINTLFNYWSEESFKE